MDIRNILNLIESAEIEYLAENTADYKNMADAFIKKINDIPREEFPSMGNLSYNVVIATINDNLSFAKRVLKRKDRVVWFLRIAFFQTLYKLHMFDNNKKSIKALYAKEFNDFKKKTGKYFPEIYNIHGTMREFKDDLSHYYSLEIPNIENTVIKNQSALELITEFGNLEDSWAERRTVTMPYDPNDGTPIITFPDGFVWLKLDRHYCDVEAKAMGHCGNAASDNESERIISLRKKVGTKESPEWEPFLTFIIDSSGFLGETKGIENQKPLPKFYPYILALLKSPEIIGIKGGGYKPENNFQLSDLPPEMLKELEEARPDFNDIVAYYHKNGFNDKVQGFIENRSQDLYFSYTGEIFDKKYIVLETASDIGQALDAWGDEKSIQVYDNAGADDYQYGDFEKVEFLMRMYIISDALSIPAVKLVQVKGKYKVVIAIEALLKIITTIEPHSNLDDYLSYRLPNFDRWLKTTYED